MSRSEFDLIVTRATMDGNGQAILQALASLPQEAQPRELVRRGFLHRGKTVSFVDLCVDLRAAGVLAHVASQAPYGLRLSDFSHCRPVEGWSDKEVYRSLAFVATNSGYVDGLKLALKLEPENADLFRLHEHLGQNATLHYLAVHKACGMDMREHLLGVQECALLLHAHGAPIRSRGGDDPNPLAGAFFARTWPKAMTAQLPGFLKHYVQAGMLDLDAPLHFSIPVVGGFLPLAAAMRNGCPASAREAILLGCNCNGALDSESADVLEMARSTPHPDWMRAELVSSITEALMLRQAAATPTPTTTTTARRAKRASL